MRRQEHLGRSLRRLALGPVGALVVLVALAASPFVYRALPAARSLHTVKIAVLVAFSGQLQARGNDLYAAVNLAVQDERQAGSGQRITLVTALDDQGQPAVAVDQARGAAADPAVRAVLCCTTLAAQQAVASFLPTNADLRPLTASTTGVAAAEAAFAVRQFGAGAIVIVNDEPTGAKTRIGALTMAFRAAGDDVRVVTANPAAGVLPDQTAAAVAGSAPALIVFDANYPAVAVLAAAIRSAGVKAPMLGDDRLDGAPAAALLGTAGPLYYVAPDRSTLLRQTPATFAAAFSQARGHAPSARDILAYQQTRAAIAGQAVPSVITAPLALYQVVPGVYPGQRIAGGIKGGT